MDHVALQTYRRSNYTSLTEQVETLLGTQAPAGGGQDAAASEAQQNSSFAIPTNASLGAASSGPMQSMMPATDYADPGLQKMMDDFGMTGMNTTDDYPWEMIGLGLEEPLPSQDIVDDM